RPSVAVAPPPPHVHVFGVSMSCLCVGVGAAGARGGVWWVAMPRPASRSPARPAPTRGWVGDWGRTVRVRLCLRKRSRAINTPKDVARPGGWGKWHRDVPRPRVRTWMCARGVHHPSGRATAPSGAEPRYASTSTHRVTSHRRAVAGKAGSYSTTWVMGARCAGTRVRKRSHAIDAPADGVRPHPGPTVIRL